MDFQDQFAMLKKVRSRFGWSSAAKFAHYQLLNSAVTFRGLQCVELSLEDVDPTFLACPEGCEHRFLTADDLLDSDLDPALDLDREFARAALAKGDRCQGIYCGDDLVSYGWYSLQPTEVFPGLHIHFDPGYVYMYKGFTLKAHRGQQLHAVGMALALRDFRQEGVQKIVSIVEETNFPSLRSCYRMGYKDFGVIRTVDLAGAPRIFHSPGCRRYGFRLRPEGTTAPTESATAVTPTA